MPSFPSYQFYGRCGGGKRGVTSTRQTRAFADRYVASGRAKYGQDTRFFRAPDDDIIGMWGIRKRQAGMPHGARDFARRGFVLVVSERSHLGRVFEPFVAATLRPQAESRLWSHFFRRFGPVAQLVRAGDS